MPTPKRIRRSVPHTEHPGGVVFLSWRLDRAQSPLNPEERQVVFDIVCRCEPEFAELFGVVIMDDHAHALVRPSPGITANRLVAAWKNTSAHRLCAPSGRTTPLWQRGYFDRWMDAPGQIDRCRAYIRANPGRRWPTIREYPWVLGR